MADKNEDKATTITLPAREVTGTPPWGLSLSSRRCGSKERGRTGEDSRGSWADQGHRRGTWTGATGVMRSISVLVP